MIQQHDDSMIHVVLFLCSHGEAPASGPANLQVRPSGGGPPWAGVRPELPGPLRSSGRPCSAKNSAGPSLQRLNPRTGTPACGAGTSRAAKGSSTKYEKISQTSLNMQSDVFYIDDSGAVDYISSVTSTSLFVFFRSATYCTTWAGVWGIMLEATCCR